MFNSPSSSTKIEIMIKFWAEKMVYSVNLLCILLFCSNLIESHAQETGTPNNETNPNIPLINSDPVSEAGTDATYTEGEKFFVDGSGSTDPDGDKLSYSWKQLTPSSPTMDITTESVNFYSNAPEVIENTAFELELTVEDGKGGKDSDVVRITVIDNEGGSDTSLLSRPKSDATASGSKNDTLLPSSALAGGALPGKGKNETLLPSSALAGGALPGKGKNETLLPSSALAGGALPGKGKNETLLPSSALAGGALPGKGKNETLLPSSALAGGALPGKGKNETLLPSTPGSSTAGSSDTLLPSIDELIKLEESEPESDFEDLNVVAVGDWGCDEVAKATVKNIQSISPEITLALGDFSYEPTAECWLNLVKPIEKNLKLIKGNHDIKPAEQWDQYISSLDSGTIKSSKTTHMTPISDGYYYSFTQNSVHFLIMDSEVSLGPDTLSIQIREK